MAQEAGLEAGGAAQAAKWHGPPEALAGLVKYLEEEGLLEFHVVSRRDGGRMDYAAMDNRIRMHALVLLANRFGLGSPYECDEYNFGPRSSALAEDARALSEELAGLYARAPAAVPGTFRKAEFEALVAGRDRDWLLAASKLVDMRAHRSTRERLMETVLGDRPAYTREYVSGLLGELEAAGLVTEYR